MLTTRKTSTTTTETTRCWLFIGNFCRKLSWRSLSSPLKLKSAAEMEEWSSADIVVHMKAYGMHSMHQGSPVNNLSKWHQLNSIKIQISSSMESARTARMPLYAALAPRIGINLNRFWFHVIRSNGKKGTASHSYAHNAHIVRDFVRVQRSIVPRAHASLDRRAFLNKNVDKIECLSAARCDSEHGRSVLMQS